MTAAPPVDIGTLIWYPEWRHGRACIAGTGMSVHIVAVLHRQGETADEIAAEYPHVPGSHIHAAVAYYLANRDLIDAELAEDEAEENAIYEQWKAGDKPRSGA